MAGKPKKELIEEVIEVKEDPMDKIREERQRKTDVRNRIKKENVELVMMNTVTTGQVYYKCARTGASFEFNEFADTNYFDFEVLIQMKNEHPRMFTEYILVPISIMHEDITLEEYLEVLGLEKIYNEDMLFQENLDDIIDMNEKRLIKFMDTIINENYLNRISERAVSRFKQGQITEDKLAIIVDYIDGGFEVLEDIVEDMKNDKMEKVKSRRKTIK